MRALALAALVFTALGAAAGCSTPHYGNGHLQCGPAAPACPSGFYCASDSHCWLTDSGPPGAGADLAVTTPSDLAGLLLDLASGDLAVGPSKCTGSMAILCEPFESALLLNGWSMSTTNGSITVDSTRPFRGASSLHSTIQASAAHTSPHADAHEMKSFPVLGVLYARVWAYYPSPLSPQFQQFLNFTDAGTTGISVATDSGKVTLDDYAGAVYQSSATKLPLDRWTCIQFQMSQGSPAGSVEVSVDGALLTDLPQTAIATPTAVNLILGVDFDANNAAVSAYEAWFDELIIDNKPINCND
jgi:hypothetical protein